MEHLNDALDEAAGRLEALGRGMTEAAAQVAALHERSADLGERLDTVCADANERCEALADRLAAASDELRAQAAGVREASAQLEERASALSAEAAGALAAIRAELDALDALDEQVRAATEPGVAGLVTRGEALAELSEQTLAVAGQRLEAVRGQAQDLRDQAGTIQASLAAAVGAAHEEMQSLAAEIGARSEAALAEQGAFVERARAELDGLRRATDQAVRAGVEQVAEAFAAATAAQLAQSLEPLQAAIERFEEWRDGCAGLFEDRFGEAADRVREVSAVIDALKPLLGAARALA